MGTRPGHRIGDFILAVAYLVFAMGTPAAQAMATLDVQLVRGGLDLDLGTVVSGEPSRVEELDLTVTNTGGKQYRIYQELPDGLRSERGSSLPENGLIMQISGGLTGTRGLEGIVPVSRGPQELFVSDGAGTSTTLRIAYTFSSSVPVPLAGAYRGILRFTVESLDSGALVTHTVVVRLSAEPLLRFVPSAALSSQIQLGEIEPGESSPTQTLSLEIVNNTAAATQVTQELIDPLVNGRGDFLARDALTYSAASDWGNQPWRPLTSGPETIFTDERGELRGLQLAYTLHVPSEQPAGTYHGRLRVRLLSLGTSLSDDLLLPIEALVKEVFTLSVTSPESGGERLRFNYTPGSQEELERSLLVQIRTNMGRPYQVLAGLDHPLVHETGQMLPKDALVLSLSSPQHGRALHASDNPVAVGYEPLYESDAKGSSDTFIVTYRLTIPSDAGAGLYTGQLRFTITLF